MMLRIGSQCDRALASLKKEMMKKVIGFILGKETRTTMHTEEALAYGMMVTSILATLRMVITLATTSPYSVMVGSEWGRNV